MPFASRWEAIWRWCQVCAVHFFGSHGMFDECQPPWLPVRYVYSQLLEYVEHWVPRMTVLPSAMTLFTSISRFASCDGSTTYTFTSYTKWVAFTSVAKAL